MPVPLIGSAQIRELAVIGQAPNGYLVRTASGKTFVSEPAEGVTVVLNQKVFVRLSSDGTMIYYCGPWDGLHPGEFLGFVRGRDQQIPVPIHKPGGERRRGRNGGWYITRDRDTFAMEFRLLAEPFAGVRTSTYFEYNFVIQQDGQVGIAGGASARRLWSALASLGMNMDVETIPPSENVLPWLEQRLLELTANRQFLLGFDNGWLETIYQAQNQVVFTPLAQPQAPLQPQVPTQPQAQIQTQLQIPPQPQKPIPEVNLGKPDSFGEGVNVNFPWKQGASDNPVPGETIDFG